MLKDYVGEKRIPLETSPSSSPLLLQKIRGALEKIEKMLLFAPFQMMVFGHSQQGKTTLVLQIVKQISKLCINAKFKSVRYHYAVYDEKFENFPNIEFIGGPPGEIQNTGEHTLIIADDFMDNKQAMSRLTSIFLKESHHFKASIIVLMHALFHPTMRQISLNCKVFVLFPSIRDKKMISTFFGQLDCPTTFLNEIYIAATKKKILILVH